MKQFLRYAVIGVFNTLAHWLCFWYLSFELALTQSASNLLAFLLAVTLSFLLNSKITFNKKLNLFRFLCFSLFMGLISWLTGFYADKIDLSPMITPIVFSGISFILGFLFSKHVVFRSHT